MANQNPNSPQDRLMDHAVDGIQEYDNPMPRWWLMTFAGTVIFSVIYLMNVGPVGVGKGRIAAYEADMAAAAAAHPVVSADIAPEDIASLVKDAKVVADGKAVFGTNCAVCHRADAGGLIGPNLTDTYWLHGGTPADIYKTITLGVLDKGMPPWGKVLKAEQVRAVAAYVVTLKGTNPPAPKAPQGDVVK